MPSSTSPRRRACATPSIIPKATSRPTSSALSASRGDARFPARAQPAGLHLLGLRCQHHNALRGNRKGRHADVLLRRHQEGDGGDGPFLRPSLRPADNDVPLLHGLRTLGTTRHGALQVHPRDPRRGGNRRLQPRSDEPRLHLYRRPRGRDRAIDRSRPRAARNGPRTLPRATACPPSRPIAS
jgi:hypothetical protein